MTGVRSQQRRGEKFLSWLVGFIPRWGARHIHAWETTDRSIIAESRKGKRDKIFVRGDYQQCVRCPEGRIVPEKRQLYVVGCLKEI